MSCWPLPALETRALEGRGLSRVVVPPSGSAPADLSERRRRGLLSRRPSWLGWLGSRRLANLPRPPCAWLVRSRASHPTRDSLVLLSHDFLLVLAASAQMPCTFSSLLAGTLDEGRLVQGGLAGEEGGADGGRLGPCVGARSPAALRRLACWVPAEDGASVLPSEVVRLSAGTLEILLLEGCSGIQRFLSGTVGAGTADAGSTDPATAGSGPEGSGKVGAGSAHSSRSMSTS